MQPLSVLEIQKLALELNRLAGAHLQEVKFSNERIGLAFYKETLKWIIFDMNARAPQILSYNNVSDAIQGDQKKPITLFLRAHFIGSQLLEVEAPLDLGRVIFFHFKKGIVEVRLFPSGQNVIVHLNSTKVSLHKPQELKTLTNVPVITSDALAAMPDLLEQKSKAWRDERLKTQQTKASQGGGEITKLSKALEKLADDIRQKQNKKWQEVGEWINQNQSLDVPSEWSQYVQADLTLAQNIENCFRRAKDLKEKIRRSLIRKKELEDQIEIMTKNVSLVNSIDGQMQNKIENLSQTLKQQSSALQLANARGRTFELDNNLKLIVGKSAEDNIKLLRKAKPWHIWIHLKDEPSAHGFIALNKNEVPKIKTLHLAAHQLILAQYKEKAKRHVGDKFSVIICECRYVRPIKGDRLGRVHYSQEQTLVHQFEL